MGWVRTGVAGALFAAWGVLGCSGGPNGRPDGPVLKGGETIVFFGDSITQGGAYVEYVTAFLETRFPDASFRVINAGISSETISGTSETDHNPRRPWAHDRFTRDVAARKPDLIVSCFGMNDGNYHPFEPVRFRKFQQGIRRLIHRVRKETRARLLILTPPPYDPYGRKAGDPGATEYGYKFPSMEYDRTLREYSDWLTKIDQSEEVFVADLHAVMSDHLRRRRETKVSFRLQGDGVHPGPTGHWLMAQTVLDALNVPGSCADIVLRGERPKATRSLPIPMPEDPRWDQDSIALERVRERFNRCRLRADGLTRKRYRVVVDGVSVGEATRKELEEGVDLLRFPEFPMVKISQEVLKKVQERQRVVYRAWRRSLKEPDGKALREAAPVAEELSARIAELCRPKKVSLELVPF